MKTDSLNQIRILTLCVLARTKPRIHSVKDERGRLKESKGDDQILFMRIYPRLERGVYIILYRKIYERFLGHPFERTCKGRSVKASLYCGAGVQLKWLTKLRKEI